MGEYTICLIHCFLAFCQMNLLVFMSEAKSQFSEIHSYPAAMRAIFGKAYIVILSQLLIMNVICQLHYQMHCMLVLPMGLPLEALKGTQQECILLPSHNHPSSRPLADTHSWLRWFGSFDNSLVISTHPAIGAPGETYTNTLLATCHFYKDAGTCLTYGLCGIIGDRTGRRVFF